MAVLKRGFLQGSNALVSDPLSGAEREPVTAAWSHTGSSCHQGPQQVDRQVEPSTSLLVFGNQDRS